MANIGYRFQPGVGDVAAGGEATPRPQNPANIRVLNLRLPHRQAPNSIAPQALLEGGGSAAAPGLGVLELLTQLAPQLLAPPAAAPSVPPQAPAAPPQTRQPMAGPPPVAVDNGMGGGGVRGPAAPVVQPSPEPSVRGPAAPVVQPPPPENIGMDDALWGNLPPLAPPPVPSPSPFFQAAPYRGPSIQGDYVPQNPTPLPIPHITISNNPDQFRGASPMFDPPPLPVQRWPFDKLGPNDFGEPDRPFPFETGDFFVF